MKQEEYKLQKAVCQYLDLNNVLYCGSMGGQYQVHFSQRIKAKATGYKSGFPDLFIYEISSSFNNYINNIINIPIEKISDFS